MGLVVLLLQKVSKGDLLILMAEAPSSSICRRPSMAKNKGANREKQVFILQNLRQAKLIFRFSLVTFYFILIYLLTCKV